MLSFKVFSKGKEISHELPIDFLSFKEVGLFETMRIYSGVLFQEEEHLNRLMESGKTAGYPHRLDKKNIKKEMHQAIKAFGKKEATVRLICFNDHLFVMMGERKHPANIFKSGVRLRTSPVRRTLSNATPAEVKTSAYQNSVLASLEPRDKEIYEWVILDGRGYVTEVRVGNLFIVTSHYKNGKEKPLLKTPPVDGILNGVTRRFVIECALLEKIDVSEDYLTRHEIYNAREAFLSNTSWEILPIRELDARKIGQEIPGQITLKLKERFKQRVKKECQR